MARYTQSTTVYGYNVSVVIARSKRAGRNPSTGERLANYATGAVNLNYCTRWFGKRICVHVPKYILGRQPLTVF